MGRVRSAVLWSTRRACPRFRICRRFPCRITVRRWVRVRKAEVSGVSTGAAETGVRDAQAVEAGPVGADRPAAATDKVGQSFCSAAELPPGALRLNI